MLTAAMSVDPLDGRNRHATGSDERLAFERVVCGVDLARVVESADIGDFGYLAGAWLGGLALFLGLVFFVKYSFENNLVTPQMRIALGAMAGLGLVGGGLMMDRARFAVTVPCIPGIPRAFSAPAGYAPNPISVVITGTPVRSAKAAISGAAD